MNIGVAKPSIAQLENTPHHFVSHLSVTESFTAADYEAFALTKVQEIFEDKDFVIMTGGTGLYIKAFAEGLDHIPPVEENIRKNVQELFAAKGLEALQEELQLRDPVFSATEGFQNPQRAMRALEVFRGTGNPIHVYQRGLGKQRDFKIIKICLQPERHELYAQINKRVDEMVQTGLRKEVEGLIAYKACNALQTVGYKEYFEFLEGRISEKEAIESIKQNTRKYAKRQETWFKKQPGFTYCAPGYDAVKKVLKDNNILSSTLS